MDGDTEQTTTEEAQPSSFLAGFEQDENAEPMETPAEPAVSQEPAEPAAPAEPAPEYVQITRQDWESMNTRAAKVDEISATLDKRFDQVLGTMGRTLERKLSEIQSGTPKGESVQISDDDFADLKKEYPELAEYTINGLNKVIGRIKGTGGADADSLARIVDERVQREIAAVRSEVIDNSLDAVMPDWKMEVNSPRFHQWITSQKGWSPILSDKQATARAMADPSSELSQWVKANPAEPVSLFLSPKVSEAARMLRAYEKSLSAPPPAAPKSQPAQPSIRQRQIAAAVPPKGDGTLPPSGKRSSFLEGFEDDD